MSYGRKLKKRKNKRTSPKGRTSWKDAKNQARGNTKWMLDNFKAREIISILTEEKFKEEKSVYPVKKRYEYLNYLDRYFSEMQQKCESEIEKIEEISSAEDLETRHENEPEDGLKELICQ